MDVREFLRICNLCVVTSKCYLFVVFNNAFTSSVAVPSDDKMFKE